MMAVELVAHWGIQLEGGSVVWRAKKFCGSGLRGPEKFCARWRGLNVKNWRGAIAP
jgi:hypothetical protein